MICKNDSRKIQPWMNPMTFLQLIREYEISDGTCHQLWRKTETRNRKCNWKRSSSRFHGSLCKSIKNALLSEERHFHFDAKIPKFKGPTMLSYRMAERIWSECLLCICLWWQKAIAQTQLVRWRFQSGWCCYQFPSSFLCSEPVTHHNVISKLSETS